MVNLQNMPEPDIMRIKEISEYITKSMLDRSYPAVNVMHYFEKYSINKELDPQFMHALAMMEKGGIIRLDKDDKIASNSAFVLLDEDGQVKMHHMIDDDYGSNTFGVMMNDPYEGELKRQTCYKHLENGYTEGCEKCELEKNSQICMEHNTILSECEKCQHKSALIKETVNKSEAEKYINAKLQIYKKQYWSFEK